MKMIEKIDGKDLRDGDVKKVVFRCKKCGKILDNVKCSNCKTINKIYAIQNNK